MALLLVAALGWFFPARWALHWMAPSWHGLHLQQVHGTVWNGSVDQVLQADGSVLGRLRWRVSRRILLAPAPLQLDFVGSQLAFSGAVRAKSKDQVYLDHVRLRVDMALWRPHELPAWGQPRGQLTLTVDHAVLQGTWPLQLDLRAQWRDAALLTTRGEVALGAFDAHVTARAGVIDATVQDTGTGPLQLAGTVRANPLGWWLDARLRVRRADPILQHWLATLGTVDAAGSVHVHHRQGFAPTPPAAPAGVGSGILSSGAQRGQ